MPSSLVVMLAAIGEVRWSRKAMMGDVRHWVRAESAEDAAARRLACGRRWVGGAAVGDPSEVNCLNCVSVADFPVGDVFIVIGGAG